MPLHGFGVETSMTANAATFGGKGFDFKQLAYVNAWMAEGKISGKFKEGVCQGLTSLWIASHGDWSVFKNIIQTPGGVAKVEEFMQMQNVDTVVGRPAVARLAIKQVACFDIKCEGEQLEGKKMSAHNVALYAANKVAYAYLAMYGKKGGHAIAMRCDAGRYQFFDPNEGLAVFTQKTLFTDFIHTILDDAYPEYNQDYYMMRFN